jgi:drug/metabolite transporter (DMT)-like permease
MACLCYGIAAVLIKQFSRQIQPKAMAAAGLLMAFFVLFMFIPFSPVRGTISLFVIGNVIGLGIICSAIAYILYYRLIADIGPTKALTVTFLMPVFGIIWSIVFLNEQITWTMIFGCGLILFGTGLITTHVKSAFELLKGRRSNR